MRIIMRTTIIACLLPTTLFADGFYVGVEGGYNVAGIQKGNTNFISAAPNGILGSTNAYTNLTSFAEGGLGGLYVGYGKRQMDGVYLGAELNGDLNAASANTVDTSVKPEANVTEKLRNDLGLSLLAGYFLTNSSLLYGRVGGVWSKFESDSFSAGFDGASGDFSKKLLGGRLGIGMETYITCQISLRGEYDYTFYESFVQNSTFPFQVDPTIPTFSVPTSNHYTLRSNQFLLGLAYHFNIGNDDAKTAAV
ncbi:MAG: outer membrane beta-barrel protein [Gammaproteobacteria bacterium]